MVMSTTHPILSATEIANASSGDQSPEEALRSLAGVVRDLACRIDTLWWQHPTDALNSSVAIRFSIAIELIDLRHKSFGP
jgi:hypothetical protein